MTVKFGKQKSKATMPIKFGKRKPEISLNGQRVKEKKQINGTTAQECASDILSERLTERAAMLKKRFANTILKANQEIMDHIDKSNPMKMQQEKERLERIRREEKARIEEQIKVAEAASRRKEREAARMALQKIEKSVAINENVGLFKDLEMMGCRYLYEDTFLDRKVRKMIL